MFFILNHLVEGTVIPLELIFEHRNYIPSMFFFVPIAFGMLRCLDYFSYSGGFQVFMAMGFALLLAFQGHTTFERNDVVRSDVHLWLDNVRKAPGLSRPHINLAKHYYEAGMYEEAMRELKTAEELNRDSNLRQIGLASYNIGIYYLYQKKDVDQAERQFIKALERYPGHPSAIVGLATVHLKRGETEKAWMLMQENAFRHRNDVEMINCYGVGALEKGKSHRRSQGGSTVHGAEMERPAALGDIGRSLATARAVAEGRPVLGGGSAPEPGKPEGTAGTRGTLRPFEGRPGPRPHGGAMPGAEGLKAPGQMACRTR